MVRKVLAVLCVVMMLGSAFVINASAARRVELSGNQFLMTETSNNTANYKTTVIVKDSAYYLTDRVIGFTVMPNMNSSTSASTETVATLYDSNAATGLHLLEVIGEAEANQSESKTEWFPYPRDITNGITVIQGPFTRVVIYFVRG